MIHTHFDCRRNILFPCGKELVAGILSRIFHLNIHDTILQKSHYYLVFKNFINNVKVLTIVIIWIPEFHTLSITFYIIIFKAWHVYERITASSVVLIT